MPTPAAKLNRECQCMTVDHTRLAKALGSTEDPLALGTLLRTHPHLFSNTAVFVAQEDLDRMAALVAAIDRVIALPAWRQHILARHPQLRDVPCSARGVFSGFDFHVGPDGPKLIEINTNAGGALLNLALHEAQETCCPEVRDIRGSFASAADLVDMFRKEWRLARGDQPLRHIAIVDDAPNEQFLRPEFERFVALFNAHGIAARIVDASHLALHGDQLHSDGQPIDLVYNRLTDFLLTEPRHAALAAAFSRDLAVVTPHPLAWALQADKRNLTVLTDEAALTALGVDAETRAILLTGIPRTVAVNAENALSMWTERHRWFFKPAAGYGSKAAYRGDKLTRGKWQEILAAGDYVAQQLVSPSERMVKIDGEARALKLDLRNYAYAGNIQLVSARLYQGQTTNFRTAGGGFATVFSA